MKQAQTEGGTLIAPCVGCGANPVRSHPDDETLSAERNWTRTCPKCRRKMCIVCYPVGAATCVLADCVDAGEALGISGEDR